MKYLSDLHRQKIACLVVSTLGLELDATARHDTGREHVAVKLLLCKAMSRVSFVLKRLIFLPAR